MKKLLFLLPAILFMNSLFAQDTIVVQTFTLDSDIREGVFQFPDDPGATYEKIIMQYRMRCFDALVGNGNVGCHEWDYHCNTVVTDSSYTDSIWATHPSYVITGSSANPFYYVDDPTFNYFQYIQKDVYYNTTISEDSAVIGDGTLQLDIPFNTDFELGKTQLLYTKEELLDAGFSAGVITGLRLTTDIIGSDIDFLKIKLKHTSKTELDNTNPDTDGFTEVYFLNTSLQTSEKHSFNFYQNFTWDGDSNLLVELSYTNSYTGDNNTISGHSTSFTSTLHSNTADGFLSVSQGDYIEVPAEAFAPIDSFITVSFWQYGDADLQPFDSYIFEGVDANNNRVINCHLPWSNSRIYWDAGNSGTSSYDRIDKEAEFNEYAGQWNHWALTKNAVSGEMKMYLNGSLWHSGTGKTNSMAGIVKFKIAGNANAGMYAGFINDFRVWNTDLSESTIQEWMYRDVDDTHPDYNNLLVNYRLDEPSGNIALDYSANGFDGTISGQPIRISFKGHQLSRNFVQGSLRPNIEFIRGTYFQTVTEYIFMDSLQKPYNIVYDYYVENNDLFVNDTNYFWEAGDMNVYDESNNIVDYINIAPADSIIIETLEYYQKWPARYELLSFITPYGNGLDLGQEGKMWEFDVTDFTPVLKGEKYLSIEGVGKNSEEYDIRFLFIEGTPARDVISIQSIWPIASASSIWYSTSADAIWNDIRFEPREVLMQPYASYYKIRSAVTGHGQSGEFIPKYHYMNIDGGDNEFEYYVWNECSTIPIYPQGGTWIYDRAGWCPGDPTTLFEFDITEYVSPGQMHTIDYGLTNISGLSQADYRISNQLVSYGAANHMLDAAIIRVGKPNGSDATFERFNPACMYPAVIIQNSGSTPITSLEFEYYVDNGEVLSYAWTGELNFLDTTEVILPVPNFTFWFGSSNHFNVIISNPNGATDEYLNNNHYRIEYNDPDAYEDDENLALHCLTNNYGYQTSYSLIDASGNILLERDGLENNTWYIDELNLVPGCYRIRIDDSADDGLYWWHNSSQGTGAFLIKNEAGYTVKYFEPEFGRYAIYEFTVYNETNIEEQKVSSIISVYPNPTADIVNLEVKGLKDQRFELTVFNTSMMSIKKQMVHINSEQFQYQFSLDDLPTGVYFVNLKNGQTNITKKIVKR